jgi:hypothetical protein
MVYEVLFVVTIENVSLWVKMQCHVPEAHGRNTLGMWELQSFEIELGKNLNRDFNVGFFLRF